MVRHNTRRTCFALPTLAALLVAGCGLTGDLYIPGAETETAPADARSPDAESPETVNPNTANAATVNPDDEQESTRSTEQKQ